MEWSALLLSLLRIGHTEWSDQTPPTTANWSQRAIVGQPSYVIGGWGISGNGAPWETAAALCNAVGAGGRLD